MIHAQSITRLAFSLVALATFALGHFTPAANAQTIDVSLNVFYSNPFNTNSGGTWEIVAKSSNFGIANLGLQINNINFNAALEGPRGIIGGEPVGFSNLDQSLTDIFVAQIPAFSGQTGIFYGVGTIANGEPGDIGPAITGLTSPAGIPWAIGDAFNDSAWNTAATLASGTFNANLTPAFGTGHNGQVFTSVGTSNAVGFVAFATISTIIRTNFTPGGLPGDYNQDGAVNAADYIIWRKGLPAADGNNDSIVNELDYDIWHTNFGTSAPGSGSGQAGTVPEPAAGLIAVLALICSSFVRRRR